MQTRVRTHTHYTPHTRAPAHLQEAHLGAGRVLTLPRCARSRASSSFMPRAWKPTDTCGSDHLRKQGARERGQGSSTCAAAKCFGQLRMVTMSWNSSLYQKQGTCLCSQAHTNAHACTRSRTRAHKHAHHKSTCPSHPPVRQRHGLRQQLPVVLQREVGVDEGSWRDVEGRRGSVPAVVQRGYRGV